MLNVPVLSEKTFTFKGRRDASPDSGKGTAELLKKSGEWLKKNSITSEGHLCVELMFYHHDAEWNTSYLTIYYRVSK